MADNNVYSLTRRKFLTNSAVIAGASLLGISNIRSQKSEKSISREKNKSITVDQVDSNFERESLIRPFGFKGGYMTEIWQTVALMESKSGIRKIGLCTQNVLWSDAMVFATHSENGGNALMYAMTEHALQIAKGISYHTPIDLLERLYPEIHEYGKKITANPSLRKTFTLNSLVALDNAAWLLYAAENNITNFDDMIPPPYNIVLAYHHDKVASVPLMAYAIPIDEIKQAAQQGYFFMKIKIGQPGTQDEMLKKDMNRISEIHKAIGHIETEYSKNGKLPYYFDANGRYEEKETLLRLIDHTKRIGAYEQIAIIEEPFPEEYEVNVDDIGVRIAADESAHTDVDALKRIQMGYGAIALKAIAKTLSMTLKIAKIAQENNIPCFCADLTANPILVEWNKAIAARLSPFPGLGLGLLETNGHQNYKNWAKMRTYLPYPDASWTKTKQGIFNLDSNYYEKSGGIFAPSDHYVKMFL